MPFTVRAVDVDERRLWTDDVLASASRSAEAKYHALDRVVGQEARLLTADTLVATGGRLLGKPVDRAEARRMLRGCSGRNLDIVTAVCGGRSGRQPNLRVVETSVVLAELSDETIEAYLDTGVALDKAGALELQGAAAGFIERLDGCWSNVVGLPICAVAELMNLDPANATQAERCSGRRCGSAATTGDG